MKLTAQELMEAQGALHQLAQEPLPIAAALAVARLARAVEAEAATIEGLRRELIERHAQRDGRGDIVLEEGGRVQMADPDGWARDAAELYGAEVEIAAEPLDPATLGQITIAPAVLIQLGPVLAEG